LKTDSSAQRYNRGEDKRELLYSEFLLLSRGKSRQNLPETQILSNLKGDNMELRINNAEIRDMSIGVRIREGDSNFVPLILFML